MTDDAENYLGYIKDGDEAKRDAYVSKMDASEQESIKQGLEQQRRDYQRFPDGYEDAPDKKLTQEQLNLLGYINQLEEKYKLWEKSKEKATKMLWWDYVAKGLAKQKQQTQQSDTETEKDKTKDSSKQQTETSSTLATLSQNGRVWFINPIIIMSLFDKIIKRELKTSQAGIDFIYLAEAQKNISNKLHWPGTGSGITLGPGYDMKGRSSTNILNDLLEIGISSDVAQKVSKAAGLKNETEIKVFMKENKDVITLTVEQEKLLLIKIIPDYENKIEKVIKIDLKQHEYDALVSFVYNVGSIKSDSNLSKYLNEGKKKEAMDVLLQYNKSGGKVLEGLKRRREKEREIFEKGIYAKEIY